MYKFNSGKGAIICDKCRTLLVENVRLNERNTKVIICSKCRETEHNTNTSQGV